MVREIWLFKKNNNDNNKKKNPAIHPYIERATALSDVKLDYACSRSTTNQDTYAWVLDIPLYIFPIDQLLNNSPYYVFIYLSIYLFIACWVLATVVTEHAHLSCQKVCSLWPPACEISPHIISY